MQHSLFKRPLGFYYNIIHSDQMWLPAKVLIVSLLKAKFIRTIRQALCFGCTKLD